MSNLKDIKEAMGAGARKPDLTHLRSVFATYVVRPCEYGCDKYERANYLRATGEGPHTEPTAEDVARLRVYLRAMISHGMLVLDSLEKHQAQDPELKDVVGMKRAAYAVDTDTKPGQKVGASFLPHIAMCGSSLMMAIEQAAACGLLPVDPGTPWRDPLEQKMRESIANEYTTVEVAGCPIPDCTACKKIEELDGATREGGMRW